MTIMTVTNVHILSSLVYFLLVSVKGALSVESFVIHALPSDCNVKICASMIVKDEASNLERLFFTSARYMNGLIVADTGSTDNTTQVLNALSAKYKLEHRILHHKWVNFGHNRNAVLQAAYAAVRGGLDCTHIISLDADEDLVVENPQRLCSDTDVRTTYIVERKYFQMRLSAFLIAVHDRWAWRGVVHEWLQRSNAQQGALPMQNLESSALFIQTHPGKGARGREDNEKKFLGDANLLLEELISDPRDHRSWYYRCQSLKDAGHLVEALPVCAYRARLGGWAEEAFMAAMQTARIKQALNDSSNEIERAYMFAHHLDARRAEPFFELSDVYYRAGEWRGCYETAMRAIALNNSESFLFRSESAYNWEVLDKAAVCAFQMGAFDDCISLSKRELLFSSLDSNNRQRIENNIGHCERQKIISQR